MKKSLLALAVLGAFAGTAAAQVTLYGSLDAAYGQFKNETTDAAGVKTTNKSTGLVDGADTTLPSRWGIRASTDLGNGLKGIAHLESAVDMTSGAANATLFHRRAVVGLSGGFGTVLLGRAQTPIHTALGQTSVYGAAGIDTAVEVEEFSFGGTDYAVGYGAAPGSVRRSNSINYTSPNFGGFVANLQLVNEASDVEVGGVTTETDNKGFGGTVGYTNGPLAVVVGFDQYKEEATATTTENTTWLVGGTYDLGVAKVFANYTNATNEETGRADVDGQQYNIGVNVPMGAFALMASVGQQEIEGPGFKADGTDYVLGVNYNLAKTTYVYARAGRFGNLELDGGPNEVKNTAFAVGLRHSF